MLILGLGLRRGEVLGFAWEDVDLVAGELYVAWQVQRVGGQLLWRKTKTASSEAPLPLLDLCQGALTVQANRQREWRTKAGPAWHLPDSW